MCYAMLLSQGHYVTALHYFTRDVVWLKGANPSQGDASPSKDFYHCTAADKVAVNSKSQGNSEHPPFPLLSSRTGMCSLRGTFY